MAELRPELQELLQGDMAELLKAVHEARALRVAWYNEQDPERMRDAERRFRDAQNGVLMAAERLFGLPYDTGAR